MECCAYFWDTRKTYKRYATHDEPKHEVHGNHLIFYLSVKDF